MKDEQEQSNAYEGWALLELMGHRRLAGKLSAANVSGVPLLRIDVFPGAADAAEMTQFYAGGAIYCVTPVSEKFCREFGNHYRPAPVTQYEFQRLPHEQDVEHDEEGSDDEQY